VSVKTYTEAEVNALVVSAYKAARDESCISAETAEGTPCTCDAELPSHSFYCGRQPWNRIRALTLASAKAVLDEMLAKAREEGRCEEAFTVEKTSVKFNAAVERARAEEREACAVLCDEWAASNHETFTEQALAVQTCSRHIRAERKASRSYPRPLITDLSCRTVKRLGLGRGSTAMYWYATISIGPAVYRIHMSAKMVKWLQRASEAGLDSKSS